MKINNEFQKFIKASATNKATINAKTQTQLSDADFYRQKFFTMTEKFNKDIEQSNEEDWEEALRRRNAEATSQDYTDAINTRKKLKWILLTIIVIWLVFVAIIVIFQGFNINIKISEYHIYFKLADNVMNVLLTTTTASVFGLYQVVINYFFK